MHNLCITVCHPADAVRRIQILAIFHADNESVRIPQDIHIQGRFCAFQPGFQELCRFACKGICSKIIALIGKDDIRIDAVGPACFCEGIQIICCQLADAVTYNLNKGSGFGFAV